MNKTEFDYTPQGTIVRQAKRIRELEGLLTWWFFTALFMTTCCIVITALYCQHMQQHHLP